MRQYTKTKLVIQHTKDYTRIDGIFKKTPYREKKTATITADVVLL